MTDYRGTGTMGTGPLFPAEAGKQEVSFLPSTAAALDEYVCPVGTINVNIEAMAWLYFVLRETPDSPERFPHGKWATIQNLERQLVAAAKAAANPQEEEPQR